MLFPWAGNSEEATEGGRLILVSGITGRQGGAVARELMRHGFEVRGLSRNPDSARAQTLTALGIEMVKGDFDRPDTIAQALDGVYGTFSVQNYWEHGKEAETRQGIGFADAALAAGVTHFVFSSVAHADESTGIAHFDSKYEIEEHIRAMGLPYTIFRPVAFMENWEFSRDDIIAGEMSGPFSRETVRQQISVGDIGRFVAEAFDHPDRWLGISLDIAADEYTTEQATEIFSRVIGRAVEYYQVSWDDHLQREGEDMADMDRWIEEVGYHVDLDRMREYIPELVSLEDYLLNAGWGGAGD